jgi:hypothetical protein
LAVCVPKVYSDSTSAPDSRDNRSFGTMKCTFPFILQMEQLQTLDSQHLTRKSGGNSGICYYHAVKWALACKTNVTARQWQPPRWVIRPSAMLMTSANSWPACFREIRSLPLAELNANSSVHCGSSSSESSKGSIVLPHTAAPTSD